VRWIDKDKTFLGEAENNISTFSDVSINATIDSRGNYRVALGELGVQNATTACEQRFTPFDVITVINFSVVVKHITIAAFLTLMQPRP
jgi:hypothetical protein